MTGRQDGERGTSRCRACAPHGVALLAVERADTGGACFPPRSAPGVEILGAAALRVH